MPLPSVPIAAIRQPAWAFGPDGRVAAANDLADTLAGQPLVGHTIAEVGRIFQYRHDDGTPFAPAELPASRAIKGEEVLDLAVTVALADGSEREIVATASPIRDGDVITGALVLWQDVTERKRAEEAEARLRALLDHNPCLVFLKDEQGRYVYLNRTYEDRFVHSADWAGKTDYDFWPAASAELFQANDRAVLASGQTHQFLEDSTDLDGTRYCWFNYKFPFVDAQGRRFVGGIGIDATPRVRAEEALAESEAEYRYLVEYAPTGIFEIEYAGPRFRRVNDAMCQRLGYTRDELMALNPADLLDEESRQRFAERVRTVLAGEPVDRSVAFHVLGKDGQEFWAALDVRPTYADGRVDGALVVAHDITERKRAEAALRASEEQFRRAIEDAPIPIIMHAEDGQVLQLSRTWTELTGYGPEDVPTFDAWLSRAYGEGADAVRDHVRSLFSGERRTIGIEFPVRTRDGEQRYWSFSASSPGTLADGRRYVVGMAVDITGRKKAEATLAESEERQASLLALSDAMRPLADPVEIQAEAARVLGERLGANRVAYFEVEGDEYVVDRDYTRSVPSMAGRYPVVTFSPRLLAEYRAGRTAINNDIEDDPDLSPEEKANFAAVQIRAYIGVPLVKAGAFVAGLAVHMASPRQWTPAEVTLVEETAGRTWSAVKRAQAEEALREHAENLRLSNEDLQRFAYVASHDLQEPLRSVISFSQLLERRYKGQLGTDADEYIEFIVEGGNRMQGLILDLLAFSRVNTTRQEIGRTDAEDVYAEAVRTLDVSLREADATLTHDPLPVVMADPTQLLQVFSNLISNAVKFRKLEVPLRVHVGARKLDGFWEFSVSDNGIGIEPEYFDRIFVIFQRLHTKEAYPGTGIGLAIVKRIIDRHGGRIRVESTPGEGSTFAFTLPAA